MGLYRSCVFPLLCELAMRQAPLRRLREELLSQAVEPVLEIGLGSGLNLPHYPPGVRTITAVEPNAAFSRKARRRAAAAGKDLVWIEARAEKLPLADGAFQTVVCTWTLCSVNDPAAVIGEIYRLLAPGGRYLFIEHGLSDDESVRVWQRRLNGLQQRLADGCRLTVNLEPLLAEQPFEVLEMRKFYSKGPKTHTFMRWGAARKPLVARLR